MSFKLYISIQKLGADGADQIKSLYIVELLEDSIVVDLVTPEVEKLKDRVSPLSFPSILLTETDSIPSNRIGSSTR